MYKEKGETEVKTESNGEDKDSDSIEDGNIFYCNNVFIKLSMVFNRVVF